MEIIQSEDSVYNKKTILDYINNSWLFKPRIYLYSQLKEYDLAMKDLFIQAKEEKSFKDIEEFCQANESTHHEIFQDLYKYLSKEVREYQERIDENLQKLDDIGKKLKNENYMDKDENKSNLEEEIKSLKENIQKDEESKEPFEKEMLNILKNHGKIDELDPIKALEFANDHWNVCADNEFFDYLMDVVKEYTVSGNEYKITKNLSEIGLIYKEKESYEFKKKNVTIDSDKACDLCKKKIGSTIFVVYPNLKVYHSKCASSPNIDPLTGVDFSKKKYIE
jgi:hypothetical protein